MFSRYGKTPDDFYKLSIEYSKKAFNFSLLVEVYCEYWLYLKGAGEDGNEYLNKAQELCDKHRLNIIDRYLSTGD